MHKMDASSGRCGKVDVKRLEIQNFINFINCTVNHSLVAKDENYKSAYLYQFSDGMLPMTEFSCIL